MNIKNKFNVDNLVLLNIFFLTIIPQINNVHYDPMPQFWAEISVAWGIITLFFITLLFNQKISIPKFSLGFAFFIIYLLFQQHIRDIDFVGLLYVACLEFFLCLILAISVTSLNQTLGTSKLMYYITLSLIIGALIQSFFGLMQYTGLYKYFNDMIFYDSSHPTTNIFGHFGQRNHYCHYLTWGVFASVYLFFKQKINKTIFFSLIAWLTFSLTIAGSRSVLIYFATGVLILTIFSIKNRKFIIPLITIIAISIFIFAFGYIYPLIIKLFTHIHQVNSGVDRLSDDLSSGGLIGRRMTEWSKALIMFKEFPLLGAGWNTFAHYSVYLQPQFPDAPLNSGLFTNCHNLFLQLLAETGLIGLCIALYSIIVSVYNLFRNISLESALILCMLFTTLDHSMLEYPLWYLYFLAPLVIFMSINQSVWEFKFQKTIIVILSIPVLLLIPIMVQSSFTFNHLVNINDPSTDADEYKENLHYLEHLANNSILWAYPALYVLDNYNNVDTELTDENLSVKDQLKYVNRFTNYHPYPMDLVSRAMLNWKLGNKEQAINDINIALVAYPVYKATYLSQLKDPRYKELYKTVSAYNYKKATK